MQSVPFEAEEPNGTYYEYDRNLKATVKVTSDRERTPVEKLETSFEPTLGKAPRKIAHEESQAEPAKASTVHNRGTGGCRQNNFLRSLFERGIPNTCSPTETPATTVS